jgi:hypothetical protein
VLADLLAVSPHAVLGLRDLLVRRHEIAGISDDGRARLDRVATTLLPAFAERGRGPFAECVRGAWLALGGPAAVDEQIDLDAASRFFALLADHETGGDVRDWNLFVDALADLYPTPQAGSAARVQVMTLHKAKGLEFDTVILPGLARPPASGDDDLLRWRTRPRGLMLAPIKASGGADDRSTRTWNCWPRRKPITSSAVCSTWARRGHARGCTSLRLPRSPKRHGGLGVEAAAGELRRWPSCGRRWRLPLPPADTRSRIRLPMRRPLRRRRLRAFPRGIRAARVAGDDRNAYRRVLEHPAPPCVRMGARHRRGIGTVTHRALDALRGGRHRAVE